MHPVMHPTRARRREPYAYACCGRRSRSAGILRYVCDGGSDRTHTHAHAHAYAYAYDWS